MQRSCRPRRRRRLKVYHLTTMRSSTLLPDRKQIGVRLRHRCKLTSSASICHSTTPKAGRSTFNSAAAPRGAVTSRDKKKKKKLEVLFPFFESIISFRPPRADENRPAAEHPWTYGGLSVIDFIRHGVPTRKTSAKSRTACADARQMESRPASRSAACRASAWLGVVGSGHEALARDSQFTSSCPRCVARQASAASSR